MRLSVSREEEINISPTNLTSLSLSLFRERQNGATLCGGFWETHTRAGRREACVCFSFPLRDGGLLRLEPERPLGVGGHGVVFPGVNRSSGEIMAIKQVSKKKLQQSPTGRRQLTATGRRRALDD